MSDSDFSDEFEDVLFPAQPEEITVTLNAKDERKPRNTISLEERKIRHRVHWWYIACMGCHGLVRNSWCNDVYLQQTLRAALLISLRNEVSFALQDSDKLISVKSRRLLDSLRHLMVWWNDNFKVRGKSLLYKKNWNEFSVRSERVDFDKFNQIMLRRRGNNELSSQGFLILLRSLGFQARLVFSLQPPDFSETRLTNRVGSPSPETKTVGRRIADRKNTGGTSAQRLLANMRGSVNVKAAPQPAVKTESHPVVWIEVWDKFTKKYISVDPSVLKIIEVGKFRSSLSPPSTDTRNKVMYVLGFDRKGGVRDITRRYSCDYNAKLRRRRMTRNAWFAAWYDNFICHSLSRSSRHHLNKVDGFEKEEFFRRDRDEGMPNSVGDFNNHPLYALESQLNRNEVLFPKQSCGFIRKKGAPKQRKVGKKPINDNFTIAVYKREFVHETKSAKAWFLRGRVLKMGEQPMLVRPGTSKEEEENVRLYAEFQTEPYSPPSVVDGVVPKNAYGNVDAYVSSMIPIGGSHFTGRFSVQAAKIIGVDFAPAAVGFTFSKGGSSVKTEGVIVASEFLEALELVDQQLSDEDEESAEKKRVLGLLKIWKVYVTKMKIKNRLDREHGVAEDVDKEGQIEGSEEEEEEEETSDQESGVESEASEGGFFLGEHGVPEEQENSDKLFPDAQSADKTVQVVESNPDSDKGLSDVYFSHKEPSKSAFEADSDDAISEIYYSDKEPNLASNADVQEKDDTLKERQMDDEIVADSPLHEVPEKDPNEVQSDKDGDTLSNGLSDELYYSDKATGTNAQSYDFEYSDSE